MANTVTVTNSATYFPSATPTVSVPLPGVTSLSIVVSGNIYVQDIMLVNSTDTTIQLGGLSSPFGIATFKNLDPVNAISVRVAAAGTKFMRLLPGECWQLRLDSGISAPVAIADAGTPQLFYSILPP